MILSKRHLWNLLWVVILSVLACSKHDNPIPPSYVWDIDKQGIPKFVNFNYIELNKIYRISKFRSSVGHDYSDAYEHCRSLKHYFEPFSNIDWSTVKVYSPVSGTLTRVEQEWAGTKLEIESDTYKAFRFQIFHINPVKAYKVDDKVVEGEFLGTHISTDTYSDISVIVNDPTKQGRFVSYFDVITDNVFQQYELRGATTRENFKISKVLRDANPLSCSGDTFTGTDPLENQKWHVFN
jgi:hypothetical protein